MDVVKNVAQRRPQHGLQALKRRVSARGMAAVDGRTTAMRAVAAWKAAIVRDLGGDPSAQELTLIDAATKTMLYLNHVDSWLMEQPSLVNKRKRAMLPVLRERQALVDSLSRLLAQIGLERKAQPIKPLAQYIEEKEKSE